MMYKKIEKKQKILDLYLDRLIKDNVISEAEAKEMEESVWAFLHKTHEEGEHFVSILSKYCEKTNNGLVKEMQASNWEESPWKGFKLLSTDPKFSDTCISEEMFKMVGKAMTTVPERFKVHSFLQRVMERKKIMIEKGEGIDWATAEALAIGSILAEGINVRIILQDVERGTFGNTNY
jgi:2-oxoglutarate dehydrogenase E1 component